MATNKTLAEIPSGVDECGCSVMDGRCPTHKTMMIEIHHAWQTSDTAFEIIWSLQDGYGIPGFMPEQGYDWSGVRDSSTAAVEAMYKAIHA